MRSTTVFLIGAALGLAACENHPVPAPAELPAEITGMGSYKELYCPKNYELFERDGKVFCRFPPRPG